ncbi:hypothetical protein K469DRAFT_476074, partial [Zopfia rhizophila CBS 207.26]
NESRYNSQTTLRPKASPYPPTYSPVDQRDAGDRASLKSFETYASSSSTSNSIEKIKSGWNRIRRKPVPRYLQGSIRRHPAAEIEPTRIGRGIWKDQLLVDRSLRSMAACTTLFAVGMFIVIATHLKPFSKRVNKFTTSVGGETKDCKTVTHTNTALLLLINVAATMVLGMSNTYQQLVTSLKISDLKHMLQKYGDSRVGTNSPFSINHKQDGKKSSWAAWLLLIATSMPVHFLANSLIGPSYILAPPPIVQYNESTWESIADRAFDPGNACLSYDSSFVCWSAFRTGKAHFPTSLRVLAEDDDEVYGAGLSEFGTTYSRMVIQYAKENCTGFANSTNDVARLEAEYHIDSYGSIRYYDGACRMGQVVFCSLFDPKPAQCRLNVRMNAAFILAGCLIIKAIY